jgi:phospholipid-binding lipoprotein MlaA
MLKTSFALFDAGVARTAAALALAGLVATGCTRPTPGAEVNDPYEAGNRVVHRFNVAVDRTFFGDGTTRGVIPTIPKPVGIGFSNFASNLGMPSAVLNSLLQAKPGPALQNTLRFAVNSTVGIGGLFDPASAIGIPADPADFGETLHVWGVGEGAYLEVPFLGPSTERDIAGTIIDIAIDPVNTVVNSREAAYITVGRLTSKVGNRQRFADTYESILYDSADSYAQARLLYLQSRHYELGIEEETFDPYEDPYAE